MSEFLDPKKNFKVVAKLAALSAIVFAGLFITYLVSDQNGRDVINQATANLGVGTQLIPWVDRADTAARTMITRNKVSIASSIQSITHPSGKEPAFKSFKVSKLNDRILVVLDIEWKGGFIGNNYSTEVAWEFTEAQHDYAKVTFDSAPTNVMPENEKMLNNYFQTKLYPVLVQDMGS